VSNVHGKAMIFAMPQTAKITQSRLRALSVLRTRHRIAGQIIEREALAIAELLERGATIEPGPVQFDPEGLEVVPGNWNFGG
jgi:hypothetical protein